MTLKVLGSGSSGNCYILTADNGEVLILDLGLPVAEIKRGLSFNLSPVVGAIVTHRHNDHHKAVSDVEKMGMPIFKPFENDASRMVAIYGGYTIKSFPIPHDNTPNRGFLIEHSGVRILYLTDLEYCPFNLQKQRVQHILVECNYQSEYVERDSANYSHKVRGHASLETCKGIVKANLTDNLKTVLLIHLGDTTANPQECVDEVKAIVPWYVTVDYARAGLTLDLDGNDKCPF